MTESAFVTGRLMQQLANQALEQREKQQTQIFTSSRLLSLLLLPARGIVAHGGAREGEEIKGLEITCEVSSRAVGGWVLGRDVSLVAWSEVQVTPIVAQRKRLLPACRSQLEPASESSSYLFSDVATARKKVRAVICVGSRQETRATGASRQERLCCHT